jgi:Fibronectin type III domain
MPKSVYEKRAPAHLPQKPGVPAGWAYIGSTVNNRVNLNQWVKAEVWNRVGVSWWLLNADIITVDYLLTGLVYHSVTVDVTDETNPDFGKFWLTVTNLTSGGTVVDNPNLPDDMNTYVVGGLLPDTTYQVNLRTFLNSDQDWTQNSIQIFTTPANPIPLAPTSLRATWATNSFIDLAWDVPTGSTAVTYNVYVGHSGGGQWLYRSGVQGLGIRVTGLGEDSRYYYNVRGVNATGLEGPASNTLKWATGHERRVRDGGFVREGIKVSEFGSWRPDIGWNDWHYWSRKVPQDSVFQGFWTNDNRRYHGCVTYDAHDFRVRMDQKYGLGVWHNLNVTRAEIARVYRMREPGNINPQYMLWWLTNVNIFDSSGAPPRYVGHRNNRNDDDALAGHDSMKAGTAIDNLRIPRGYANAIILGNWHGTQVNGICLHRDDGENNGYGTAGYGEWCGHGQIDRHINEAHRYSDWTIYVSASWSFETVSYQGPYQW